MILYAFQFGSVEPVASVGLALRQLAVNCEPVTRSADNSWRLCCWSARERRRGCLKFCRESASMCLSNHMSAFA